MNTITDDNSVTSAWRPTPWIAAVLGLLLGGAGMLYVQRPWLALAFYGASVGVVLAILYAVWALGINIDLALMSWSGWAISIVCAVCAYKVALAATPAERKWYSRWHVLVAVPLALFLVIFLVRSFVYETYRIPSQSMQPTIPEGSWVFVTKSGFGRYGTYGITIWRNAPMATIARGDLVAYRLVSDPALTYLHRVVGVPGDRIEYTNRRLVINGNTVPVRLGARHGIYQNATERLDGRKATIAFIPERYSRDWAGIVPPEHYFVLGDNRDNARDSRFPEVGFVPRDHIVGRVVKIVKEPDR